MSGQSQPQKGGNGYGMQQPYQPYGGYQQGAMTPYSPSPAQQGSFYSTGGSMRPPMDTGSLFGSPYTGQPIGSLIGINAPQSTGVSPSMTNPLARQAGPSITPPGSDSYGNTQGQNGLVNTNNQFGFGSGSIAQLAPGTAAMLGYTRQGNNWVNAQGQVVGSV